MCVLLIYVGAYDDECDYNYIIAHNRDESYHRLTPRLNRWPGDVQIFGGTDPAHYSKTGSWFACSPERNKVGVLVNIHGAKKKKATSRGIIVTSFVKNDMSMAEYVEANKENFKQCNNFLFLGVDLRENPVTQTYCSSTGKLQTWTQKSLGFGNSLPDLPLKKVEGGRIRMEEICNQYKKVTDKTKLAHKLMQLLRSRTKYIPDERLKIINETDEQLRKMRPEDYERLSSLFVDIPETAYGTRSHTVLLVEKTGLVEMLELSMSSSLDVTEPEWMRTQCEFWVDLKGDGGAV